MTHVNSCRIEAHFHVIRCTVQPRVIHFAKGEFRHRCPGQSVGNQRANQRPGNPGIAIRKMENIWLFTRPETVLIELEIEPERTRLVHAPALQRRKGIQTEAPVAVHPVANDCNHLFGYANVLAKKVCVADAAKQLDLIAIAHARQVVLLALQQRGE